MQCQVDNVQQHVQPPTETCGAIFTQMLCTEGLMLFIVCTCRDQELGVPVPRPLSKLAVIIVCPDAHGYATRLMPQSTREAC